MGQGFFVTLSSGDRAGRTVSKDVAVIGGGPSGLAAAHALSRYGLSTVLIERTPLLGGQQALSPFQNAWLPGWGSPTAKHIARSLIGDAEEAGADIWTSTRVVDVDWENAHHRITASQGGLHCSHIVLAMGSRFAGDNFADPYFDREHPARGLIFTGTAQSGQHMKAGLKGKRVLVIGGGDNAHEIGRMAAEAGAEVVLLYRGHGRANKDLRRRFVEQPHTRVAHGEATALRFVNDRLEVETAAEHLDAFDAVYLCLGYRANSDSLAHWSLVKNLESPKVLLDDQGYVLRDAWHLETAVPGLWAIGEVCRMRNPCVATCIGEALSAARAIEEARRAAPEKPGEVRKDALGRFVLPT